MILLFIVYKYTNMSFLPDFLYCLLVGESMGWIGCSSPSSKLDFMWYFLAGVLGDVELALDSFGEDAIEHVEDDVSEKTESVLSPPPGDFSTLKDIKLLDFGVVAPTHFRHLMWIPKYWSKSIFVGNG